MKQRIRESRGITLIALVVTIIVLIILAGITINLVFDEQGIIRRAKEAKIMQDVATAKEKLELLKAPVQIYNNKVDLDGYLAELEDKKEEYKASNIQRLNDTEAEVLIDSKYKFLLRDTGLGDVEIIYQGEAGEPTGHVHSDSCYSTVCKGTFVKTGETTEEYATCSHTHTTTGNLYTYEFFDAVALSDDAVYCAESVSRDGFNVSWKISGCYQRLWCNQSEDKSLHLTWMQDAEISGVDRICSICNENHRHSLWHIEYTCPYCFQESTYDCYIPDDREASDCYDAFKKMIEENIQCGNPIFARSCGKLSGTSNYTRTVSTYTCTDCGASTTYAPAASSGTCTRCLENHSVPESGATSTTHNTDEKHLVCGYE